MMKRKKYIVGVIIVVLLALAYHHHRKQAILSQADSVFVNAVTVKETTIPFSAQAIGTITAKSVDLTPELAEHVTAILATDGAVVKKGEPIIQLDDAVYTAKLAQAKAQLAYSENNYKRMILLGKQGAISKQAIDQAEADLKTRRAEVLEDEVMVSKLKLRSPFDGVIGKIKVNPGDYLTIGQSLVTVTDTQHLRIEYTLPESFFPFLKLGQTVDITLTAYPQQHFNAKVTFISPVVNKDSRSVQLYADIESGSTALAPGMLANLTQLLGTREHAILIPARSLLTMLEGQQVYKVMNGDAKSVPVSVGIRIGDDIEVSSGLKSGDVVVTDGQIKLRDGMKVRLNNR